MSQLESTVTRGTSSLSTPQKVLALLLSVVLIVGLSPFGQAPSKAYAGETGEGDLQAAQLGDDLQAQDDPTPAVAKIGDTEYATLAAAVDAATSDATIQMVADSTEGACNIDESITLDLNGKTVTESGQLQVTAGTTTIKDTATGGNGKIEFTGSGNPAFNVSGSGAKLVLQSGKLTSATATILSVSSGATAEISGGEASCTHTGDYAVDVQSGTATISGGEINGGIAKADGQVLTVSGGTFDTDVTNFLATNATIAKDSTTNKWTVTGNQNNLEVTFGTASPVKYASLDRAIKDVTTASSKTATIKLLSNVAERATIQEGTSVTLDLNGKKLSNPNAEVTEKYTVKVVAGSTLVLEDSSTSKSGVIENLYPITSDETNDSTVIENHGTTTIGVAGSSAISGGTLSGGEVSVGNYSGTLTVNSGTFTGATKYAVDNSGAATFNGGTFTVASGATALIADRPGAGENAGSLSIAGGTFTAPAGKSLFDLTASTAATGQNGAVAISGGKFSGALPATSSTNNITTTIVGGKFSSKPNAALLGTGCVVVDNVGTDKSTYPYEVASKSTEATFTLSNVATGGKITKVTVTSGTSTPVSYTGEGVANNKTFNAHVGDVVEVTVTPDSNYAASDVKCTITQEGDLKGTVIPATASTTNPNVFTFAVPNITKATLSASFIKTATNLNDAVVTLSASSFTYNGAVQKPTVTSVVLGGKTLVANTDYRVNYSNINSTNAGSYSVSITPVTGRGLTGSKTVTYKIDPKSITAITVTLTPTSATYNTAVQTPTITAKDGAKALTTGTDFTVVYKNSAGTTVTSMTDAGTYTATVTGKGNYKDTKAVTYIINPAAMTAANVVVSPTTFVFNGSVQGPKDVTVKLGTATVPSTEYTMTPNASSSAVGRYKATIAAATTSKNLTGSTTAEYAITAFDLNKATVALSSTEFDYDGKPHVPTVALVSSGTASLPVACISVSYQNQNSTAPGTYSMTVLPAAGQTNNVTGSKTVTYKIIDHEKEEADQKAATEAGKVIESIVVTPTGADAASIEAARAAYDALTLDQKALVPADEVKKLTDAEAALASPGDGAEITGVAAGGTVVTVKVVSAEGQMVSITSSAPTTGGKLTINTVAFGGKTYLVASVAARAFKGAKAKGITKVIAGSNVKSIGGAAFAGAPNLKALIVGANVTTIGKNVCNGAKNLETLTIGKSVKTIKASAFKDTGVKVVKLKSASLTKKSCKNLVKGTNIKTVRLLGAAKAKKPTYKKWFNALGVKVK